MSNSFGGAGALCKLAIGPTGGTITRMDFLQFTPQIVKILADGSVKSIRGTLDHQQSSVAEGLLHIKFRTSMYLMPTVMDILWPQLGCPESPTDTFILGDALPDTTVILGPPGTKEQTFSGCVPTDWVMYGEHGKDPIIIDIGWIGRTWSEAANGTFFVSQSSPALLESYTLPFAAGAASGNASTLTYQLGSHTGTLGFPQFRLTMDYGILSEFNNSITATNLMPSDHECRFATSLLYNPVDSASSTPSTEPYFDVPMSGDVTGAQLVLNFQRAAPFASPANYQTQITIANMKAVARAPRIVKHDFVRLPINLEAYASGSTPMMTILNKSGEA